ncbi:hypothetical protein ARMSODRAFT_122829 [Armillaria solidipes]|uniref:Uncharacterized protein n=1 Tax=Armillaria solidipes TaxID=1076256 RepID=A0A2H3BVH0_9AGAR|nr:hypothetical protein ARMSODRAFT_122829 [Armillaria solidipes]
MLLADQHIMIRGGSRKVAAVMYTFSIILMVYWCHVRFGRGKHVFLVPLHLPLCRQIMVMAQNPSCNRLTILMGCLEMDISYRCYLVQLLTVRTSNIIVRNPFCGSCYASLSEVRLRRAAATNNSVCV